MAEPVGRWQGRPTVVVYDPRRYDVLVLGSRTSHEQIPKRATNDLLLAAGFAPVYSHLALDDAVAHVRAVLRLMLEGNDPNPTSVIDTRWNLIDANATAFWLTSGVDPDVLVPPINVARLSLHPDGLTPRVANLDAYAAHLLHSMRHTLAVTHDPQLAALIEELDDYTPAPARARGPDARRCRPPVANLDRRARPVVHVDGHDVRDRPRRDAVRAVDRDVLPSRRPHNRRAGLPTLAPHRSTDVT